MIFLFTFYTAIFGLVIGSFLNVCICRIPENQSVISRSSHCTSCGTRLKPIDLVPVFSYLFLRGSCRYCGNKVSVRYPIVEMLTAAAFVILFYRFSLSVEYVAAAFLSCILICIFFIDLDYRIIPNEFIAAGLVVGSVLLVLNMFHPMGSFAGRVWYDPILGMLCGAGILALVSLLGRLIYKTDDAMGMGDIKLMAVCGLFLGWRLSILSLLLSVVSAALVSLVLIGLKKHGIKSTIAFGPFISIGVFISVICGWNIIDLYIGLVFR